MASGIEDGGIRLADNPELHGRYADLRRDVEPTPSTRHDVGLSFGQYDRAADRFDEFSPAFPHIGLVGGSTRIASSGTSHRVRHV